MPYNFTNEHTRKRATEGTMANLKNRDPLMNHLLENIESLWKPKRVVTPNDWLVTQLESG